MTDNNHPITPSQDLIHKWFTEAPDNLPSSCEQHIAIQASRWGADKQLELDARWLDTNALYTQNLTISPSGNALRKVMRPKPPSLKEQALQVLANADGADHPVVATVLTADQHALIRRALESLPD